ncbi:MAG: HTH domain-containing protein [Clostridiales bacterium]
MGRNYFTDDQIEELQKNPYVKKVSNKALTYTDDFKAVFTEKYRQGNPPSVILREMGFDPRVLGKKRIDRFVGNVYKYEVRSDDFRDLRGENSGRPSVRELSDKERMARLAHQVKYLKQENEFLKKIEFLNRQTERKEKQKPHQKKNSNSSEK